MKANELMIGDWVQVKDCIDQSYYFDEYEPGEIVQVREILDNGINPNWAGAEVSSILDLEDIQPIPITPEILGKNGFVYEGESWWYKDFHISLSCTKALTIVCGRTIQFTFVHELQHALRLCGIEKEIVL